MTTELQLYASELERLLWKLTESLEGLGETQLNWRPDMPDANSIYVIAMHMLGNVQGWVLGIACGEEIDRDRDAEFRATGADADDLVNRARELSGRIASALAALPAESLGEIRPARQNLWGAGTAEPVSGRFAILHAIEHASEHLGHIGMTLDLMRASA
jgi:hypothetical protein